MPVSFSPDGKYLSYDSVTGTRGIFMLPLDLTDPERPKPGKPEPFLQTSATDAEGVFSPDGHWVAYQSDESGGPQVYVRPFPGPGGKWQISGGTTPVWSRNGRELFYVGPDERIRVTEYSAKGASFIYSSPRVWSDKQLNRAGGRRFLDIAPDGKRFAVFPVLDAGERQGNVHVTFLLNFADEVRRRSIPLN
jgi:serine/threonine-protein kinase